MRLQYILNPFMGVIYYRFVGKRFDCIPKQLDLINPRSQYQSINRNFPYHPSFNKNHFLYICKNACFKLIQIQA
jgi:hypothetical protein